MLQTTATGSFSAKFSPSPPIKQSYSGAREYLRPDEVEALIKAAKTVGRHGVRDATMILLMFRHGLRKAELVALKWSSLDLKACYLEVQRVKNGHNSVHPLRSPELRALRQIKRDYPETQYVFVTVPKSSSVYSLGASYRGASRKTGRNSWSGSSSSTTSCLWLLSCYFRTGYEGDSRLFGTSEHSAYGSLHSAQSL